MGRVDKRILPVIVERLPIAGSRINAGYALDLAGTGILQDKQKPLRFVGLVRAGEGAGGLFNLGGQRVLFFGQGGCCLLYTSPSPRD